MNDGVQTVPAVMVLPLDLFPASKATVPGGSLIHVDLAYLPSGRAAATVDADFFRCLRSLHYIISGDDDVKPVAMRSILDALLEGKSAWPEVQVGNGEVDDGAADPLF